MNNHATTLSLLEIARNELAAFQKRNIDLIKSFIDQQAKSNGRSPFEHYNATEQAQIAAYFKKVHHVEVLTRSLNQQMLEDIHAR